MIRIFQFLCITSLVISPHVSGFRFQIFRSNHMRGLIYDFESSDDSPVNCTTLPGYSIGIAGSARVSQCVMAYADQDCSGLSIKLHFTSGGSHPLLNSKISSFQQCNGEIGGKKTRVQMFKYNAAISADYHDVCGCQELPAEVSSDLQKLDNFGNCVTLYSSTDCRGDLQKDIPAGRNLDSENLTSIGFVIRSVAACGRTPSCVRLHSKIFKFDLNFPQPDENTLKQVELAAKTTFYNNGSSTMRQVYEASKTVKESFTVTRSSTFREMRSSTVESVEVSSATETLKNAFTFETEFEESVSESYTREEERTFAVLQEIQIPACVEYVVSSMVTLMENVEVPYSIYTRITGDRSGVKLTSEEIREHVEGLTFVEAFDTHTAVFKAEFKLFANVGVECWITGEGKDIENCQNGTFSPRVIQG